VLKLPHVQHLKASLNGRLKPGVSDSDLLVSLHPTPAVGGYPTDRAVDEIFSLALFDRGWYASPTGWIGADAAEFCVAIRSGLIDRNRLALFSGAGIVAGSRPEREWDEIENKIGSFLSLITER